MLTLALLSAALAALAALTPSIWPAVGLLLAFGGAVLLWFQPRSVLNALLLVYALYLWLDTVVFPLLPGVVPIVASVAKELALLGLVLVALVRYGMDRIIAPVRVPLIVFALLLAILILIPSAPARPSVLSARFHIEYPLLILVGAALCYRPEHRRHALRVVLGTGAVVAVAWLSALGWAGLTELEYSMATTELLFGEDSDVVNAINVLGIYMAVLVCLALGALQHASSRGQKILLLCLTGLMVWALLGTFSRRAILAVVLGSVMMAVADRRWRLLFWSGSGGAVVLALSSTQLIRRLSWEAADETGGVSLRLSHLLYTLDSMNPLTALVGHGMGTSGDIAVTAGIPGAVDIHNYYLLLTFEAGIVGLFLYLIICWSIGRHLLRQNEALPGDRADRGLVLGTIGAFTAFLVAGLFGVTNATLPVAPVVWILVGCTMAVAREAPRRPGRPTELGGSAGTP